MDLPLIKITPVSEKKTQVIVYILLPAPSIYGQVRQSQDRNKTNYFGDRVGVAQLRGW